VKHGSALNAMLQMLSVHLVVQARILTLDFLRRVSRQMAVCSRSSLCLLGANVLSLEGPVMQICLTVQEAAVVCKHFAPS
jgi:hypothetical protein